MANNAFIFNGVIAGALGGVHERWITSDAETDYSAIVAMVVEFAAIIDDFIPNDPNINAANGSLMQSIVQGVFSDRYLQGGENLLPLAQAVIALYDVAAPNQVTPPLGSITTDDVTNTSTVPGVTATDAFNEVQNFLDFLDNEIDTLDSDDIGNLSLALGPTVTSALDDVWSRIVNLDSDGVFNVSGVTGTFVTDALNALNANFPLDSSDITNVSGVTGVTVTAALNALNPVSFTGNYVLNASGEARLRSVDGMCLVSGHPNYASVAAGDIIMAANSGILIAATGVPPAAAAATGTIGFESDAAFNVNAGATSTLQTTSGNLTLTSTAGGSRVSIIGQDDALIEGTVDSVFINAGVAVAVTAASLFRVTTGGVERLEIEPDGAWQVAGATGSAGQALVSAGASAPPAWGTLGPSGLKGGILVYQTATTILANASASNLSPGAFTIPANFSAVGHTYHAAMLAEYVHTAAATPTITIEWVYNGSVVATRVITPTNVNGTYSLSVDAYFRFVTIGGSGSARATIQCSTDVGATLADQLGCTYQSVLGISTTVSATLELRMRMTTAVASNQVAVNQSYLERLILE